MIGGSISAKTLSRYRAVVILVATYFSTIKVMHNNEILEKWFPLHGERTHSLYFCIYIRRLEVSKNNRNVKEEETEHTY